MKPWQKKRRWVEVAYSYKHDLEAYEILLDGKAIRTPGNKVFSIPTQGLAEAIASEWSSQSGTINPNLMPCTRMINSTIDKVIPQHDSVINDLVGYGDTDLICYRADSPEGLIKLQNEKWNPILEWLSTEFRISLALVEGINYQAQNVLMLKRFESIIRSFDFYTLMGIQEVITRLGSLALALAIHHDFVSPRKAWDLSNLDENWQKKHWGTDKESEIINRKKWKDFKESCKFLDLLKNK